MKNEHIQQNAIITRTHFNGDIMTDVQSFLNS
uniref:Uncharacterized protein n=1 Tax=Arundo donax TaxID=35708 RepID=A0A0A9ANL5_ARUDO